MNTKGHELDDKTIATINDTERGQISIIEMTRIGVGMVRNIKLPKIGWEQLNGLVTSFVSIGVHSWFYLF